MGLDIKLPIGLMFSVIGLLLTIYGIITSSNTEMYGRSLNVNINLWIGACMLIFGIIMLIFAKRPKK